MTFRTLLCLAMVSGVLSLVPGCGSSTMESTWKSTKTLYTEYLNPPATVDYTDKGSLTDAEIALARRMRGIDTQLTLLERHLENADRTPTPESVAALLGRFSWLGGIAAVDQTGTVLAEEPSYGLKSLDYAPLVETKGLGNDMRGLRGMVQENPLGPEVFVGVPVFRDTELMGIVSVHFDMRTLLSHAEDSGDLVVLSPEAVLWPGHFDIETTPLVNRDWANLVRSGVTGIVSNEHGEFLWVVRYLGAVPLIFASPVRGEFSTNSEQMEAIMNMEGGNSVAMPVREEDASKGVNSSLLQTPEPAYKGPLVREQPITF